MVNWRLVAMLFACVSVGCDSTIEEPSDLGPCPNQGSCQFSSCEYGNGCDIEWECTLDEPCGVVDFVRDESSQAITLSTPDDAKCVLEALRDGTEGTYRWYITGKSIPGQYYTATTVHMRLKRMALKAEFESQDLSSSRTNKGPAALQDASFFEDCLTKTEAVAIFDCLKAAVLTCA